MPRNRAVAAYRRAGCATRIAYRWAQRTKESDPRNGGTSVLAFGPDRQSGWPSSSTRKPGAAPPRSWLAPRRSGVFCPLAVLPTGRWRRRSTAPDVAARPPKHYTPTIPAASAPHGIYVAELSSPAPATFRFAAPCHLLRASFALSPRMMHPALRSQRMTPHCMQPVPFWASVYW